MNKNPELADSPLVQRAATAWGSFAFRRWAGSGTPIIMMHPLSMSSRLWEPAIADIGAGRDVIAVDFRGHGDSHWDGRPFLIEDLAGDIVNLMDALGIETVDTLGMSMGGCVAMTLAATRPDRVRRLALCDTTAWYGPQASTAWEERARAAEQKPRAELIPFQTQRWFGEDFLKRQPGIVESVVDIFLRTAPAAHAQACRALAVFDARNAIAEIKAPTSVFTGEQDYATPPGMGEELARNIPGANFRIWPGVRHFSVLESSGLRRAIADHLVD